MLVCRVMQLSDAHADCVFLLVYNLLTNLKHFTVLGRKKGGWSNRLFLPLGKCTQAEAPANHYNNSNKRIFIFNPIIICNFFGKTDFKGKNYVCLKRFEHCTSWVECLIHYFVTWHQMVSLQPVLLTQLGNSLSEVTAISVYILPLRLGYNHASIRAGVLIISGLCVAFLFPFRNEQ